MACAAAYEVQQVIRDEGLVENCKKMGEYLGERLRARLGAHPNAGDIRGRGLAWAVRVAITHRSMMQGFDISDLPQIELVKDRQTKEPFPVKQKVAPTIQAAGLQKFEIALLPGGGVVDGVNGDLIVLAPAYDVTCEEVNLIVERAARAIEFVLGPTATVAKL